MDKNRYSSSIQEKIESKIATANTKGNKFTDSIEEKGIYSTMGGNYPRRIASPMGQQGARANLSSSVRRSSEITGSYGDPGRNIGSYTSAYNQLNKKINNLPSATNHDKSSAIRAKINLRDSPLG